MRHDESLRAPRMAALCVITCLVAGCDPPGQRAHEAPLPAEPGAAEPGHEEPAPSNADPANPGAANPGAPDAGAVDPGPGEPPHPEPACETPASVDGVETCLAYAQRCAVPLDLSALGCGFGAADGKAACECSSGDHGVRCEQTESGVTCTRR